MKKKLVTASFWIYTAIAFLSIYVIGRVPEAAGFGAMALFCSLTWLAAYVKANYYDRRPAPGHDADLPSAKHYHTDIIQRRAA